MHRITKLVCIGAVASLSACSSFFAKEPKNPPATLVEFKPAMAVKTAWSVKVGSSENYVFSPAEMAGDVLTASADGTLLRVNAATGHIVWKIKAESSLTAGVGANATTLAVAGEKGKLFVYDADGKLLWKAQASSDILSAPVIGGGVVVIRSVDNHIAAYDALTGVRRWVVERTLPALTLRSPAGMVINGDNVLVALPGGKLVALALVNGGLRWEAVVGEPRGATDLERVADVSGVPVVYGPDVCAIAYQGRVACFDVKNGTARWSKTLSADMGVSVDERFVFAASDRGAVSAFSRSAGLSEWKNEKLAYRQLSAPVSFGRAVAVADASGYVHFLSREDGSFLARASTDGSAIAATPLVLGSNVVFQTKAGEVVAFAID